MISLLDHLVVKNLCIRADMDLWEYGGDLWGIEYTRVETKIEKTAIFQEDIM